MRPEERFERLYRDHAAAVRAYARRRTDPVAADDVVAWRRMVDVPAEERAWLLGVARKTLANQRRSTERQRALADRLGAQPATALAPDPPSPDPALMRALAALRPADREVLLLVAWDGLTPAQAASSLGVRPSAFSMRLRRARTRLRRELDGADTPPAPPTTPAPHRTSPPPITAPSSLPAAAKDPA